MKFFQWILRLFGWRVVSNVDKVSRCIICVAPHTSNYDFIIGELASRAKGYSCGFVMKKQWFFFPVGLILRALGGIPVSHDKNKILAAQSKKVAPEQCRGTNAIIEAFKCKPNLALAMTPESTRKANPNWRTGFLRIARHAQVPVLLAYIDYKNKVACFDKYFTPSDDIEADLQSVKNYYKELGVEGRNPENFVL